MTATDLQCELCSSTYRVPSSPPVLDRFQEATLLEWLDTHPCSVEREAVA